MTSAGDCASDCACDNACSDAVTDSAVKDPLTRFSHMLNTIVRHVQLKGHSRSIQSPDDAAVAAFKYSAGITIIQ